MLEVTAHNLMFFHLPATLGAGGVSVSMRHGCRIVADDLPRRQVSGGWLLAEDLAEKNTDYEQLH